MPTKSPLTDKLSQEDLDTLTTQLNTLDEIQRDIIVLKHYHKLDFDDIAKRINMSIQDTKLIYKDGLNRLRLAGV